MTAASSSDVVRALLPQLAAFAALLLTASAGHKLAAWPRSRSSIEDLAAVSVRSAAVLLAGAVLGEFAAAALLLVAAQRVLGALLAALIWAVYLGLIVRAIRAGRRDVDCGCSFVRATRPLGAYQVARSSLLTVLALSIAGLSAGLGNLAVDSSVVLPACALLALYGALDQAMGLSPLRTGMTS